MARKITISRKDLKRFSHSDEKRKKNFREKRKFYLIICEGEETEPNYFEGLKNDLPKGVLTAYHIDVRGTGRNTQSLINEALRLEKEYEKNFTRPVDRLWVVFDRDSFTIENFNGAVERCENLNIGCAWSNEAFELWYLLHFQYYENGMSRTVYKDAIEYHLRRAQGRAYKYEKNSENMYNILKQYGSLENAIRNAKRLAKLYEGRKDYANHNPCTMVFRLIEELMTLSTKQI